MRFTGIIFLNDNIPLKYLNNYFQKKLPFVVFSSALFCIETYRNTPNLTPSVVVKVKTNSCLKKIDKLLRLYTRKILAIYFFFSIPILFLEKILKPLSSFQAS